MENTTQPGVTMELAEPPVRTNTHHDELIKDVLENPSRYTLYGTGSEHHYEANKLLFDKSLIFLDANLFYRDHVERTDRTVIVLFSPVDDEMTERLSRTKYTFLELHQFIDYKAKLFWDQKGEYKGVDKNHYQSNESVLKRLSRNVGIYDFIPTDKEISVLSLGCGTGDLERALLKYPNIQKIVALDISRDSLNTAADKIREYERASIVSYEYANLNSCTFEGQYDVVIAQECVHHVQNLERLYENVRAALKPDGLLLQSEYVGPNRFQFESRILYAVNTILKLIPKRWKKGLMYERMTEYDIIQADPSEAVRSRDIIPLTKKYFSKTKVYFHSGTLMHILHQMINPVYFYTENFAPKNNSIRSKALVRLVFFVERLFWGGRYSHMALLKSTR